MSYKDPEKKREYNRRYAREQPEIYLRYKHSEKGQRARRNANFVFKYGISIEDYERLLGEQAGVCAICGLPPQIGSRGREYLTVDHDHVTGKIRGLLCIAHNTMLGHAQDNPILLELGAKYLRERSDPTI